MGVHAKGYGQTLNANTMANAQPQYPQVVPGSAMPMAVRRGADPLFPRLPLNSKPKPSALHLGSRQPELAPRALSSSLGPRPIDIPTNNLINC